MEEEAEQLRAWRRLAALPQIRYHSTSWWSWAWQSRCSSSAELNWKRPVESHELAVSEPTVAWLELDFFLELLAVAHDLADAAALLAEAERLGPPRVVRERLLVEDADRLLDRRAVPLVVALVAIHRVLEERRDVVDLVVHRRRHASPAWVCSIWEAEEAAQVDGDGVDGVADLHDLRQRVRVVLDHLVDHPVVRRSATDVRAWCGAARPIRWPRASTCESRVWLGARLRLVSCLPVLLDFDVRVLVEDRGGDDERDPRCPRT